MTADRREEEGSAKLRRVERKEGLTFDDGLRSVVDWKPSRFVGEKRKGVYGVGGLLRKEGNIRVDLDGETTRKEKEGRTLKINEMASVSFQIPFLLSPTI